MGGGLMQLVAYGSQDVYLTGNPQITFWKVVYRRHTNFALESVRQDFNGTVRSGSNVVATISRNGDLIHKAYLEVKPKSRVTNIADVIDTVELEIGGQQIDKHQGSWMDTWNELSLPLSKQAGWNGMTQSLLTNSAPLEDIADPALPQSTSVGGILYEKSGSTITKFEWDGANNKWVKSTGDLTGATGSLVAPTTYTPDTSFSGTGTNSKLDLGFVCYKWETNQWVKYTYSQDNLFIPLEFFFCTNPGLALPLIALQYHEVRLKFTLGDKVQDAELWVDYVYLDTDERRRMAQSSHEFLITQLQHQGESNPTNARLNFNHPVKELVWKYDSGVTTGNHKLTLNGHDRMAPRDWKYFNKVQPYQHHTRVPTSNDIGVYSFALKPEDSQPSGSCNFSRIDNAQLTVSGDCDIWAVNWNVLRIMSGMGGLAYSN